jgi:DNA-binding MarR family transcriptional regulator
LDLAEKNEGKRDIDKKLAMREIGSGLGMDSGTVSLILEKLEHDGYLTIENNKIITRPEFGPNLFSSIN